MQRQLAEIVRGFERAQKRLESLAERLPEQAWTERTDPARWSVGECVAHLNMTSAAYIPRMHKAIAEARGLSAPRVKKYHRDPIGWMFSFMVGPLPSVGRMRIGRVKTMPPFVPTGRQPVGTTLAEFKRYQDELIGMLREADGLPLDKVKITSPFGERIQYSCYSAFVIQPRHQERHLDQAELVWSK
jgi:hypothetical protein